MRTIAICGFDTATRDMANSQPEEVERFGINNARTFIHGPLARVYQIHPRDWKTNQNFAAGTYGRGPGYVESLAGETGVVYLAEPDDRIPDAKIFPAQKIIDHFGRRYFTSTPAWMVAHIIYEHDKTTRKRDKVSEIRIFGITLSTTHEYFGQRNCLEWMIGHAEARSIKVEIPTLSTLMKGVLYPYAELGDDMQNLRQMAQERVHKWRQESMDHRDTTLCAMAANGVLMKLIAAIEEADVTGKKIDLGRSQQLVNATAQQYGRQGEVAFANFREAQHALLQLGGADMPPADIPMMNGKIASDIGDFPVQYEEETPAETPVEATQEVAEVAD